LGHDWRRSYRGLRINELLRAKEVHSVDDFKRYQSDVVAVHARHLVSTLDNLNCEDSAAERLRQQLVAWDGAMGVHGWEPLAYDTWKAAVTEAAWDEPELQLKNPYLAQLYLLLTGSGANKWIDRIDTPSTETASDLLCGSLQTAASELAGTEGTDWGTEHRIVFRHLISADRFASLSRGPFAYPGTSETLSPAGGRLATHSASWRVVVDLSTSPPTGWGVYPGGASGNPFSPYYDMHVDAYLAFEHYRLHNPGATDYFADATTSSVLRLLP
ncbi:MAG: penicillin acylase family protein, partial [Rhodothermales bacterium]|nr:penicillin acylase family protein [Rhodothermales bacterium]